MKFIAAVLASVVLVFSFAAIAETNSAGNHDGRVVYEQQVNHQIGHQAGVMVLADAIPAP